MNALKLIHAFLPLTMMLWAAGDWFLRVADGKTTFAGSVAGLWVFGLLLTSAWAWFSFRRKPRA